MVTEQIPRDPMQDVDEHESQTLERLVERLERRATDPTFAAYRDAYLQLRELEQTNENGDARRDPRPC